MSLETFQEVTGYTFDHKTFFISKQDAALDKIESTLGGCFIGGFKYLNLSLPHMQKHRDELITLLQMLEGE